MKGQIGVLKDWLLRRFQRTQLNRLQLDSSVRQGLMEVLE